MIDYLGMLGNPLQQQSSSSVSPAQWGQALGGMAQQAKQQEQQRAMMQQAQEALQSRDPNAIAQLMITNPELAKQVQGGIQFQNEATRQNLIGSIEGILSNPNNAEQILTDRINMIEAAGGDAAQSRSALAEFQADPDGFIKNTEILYSMQAPDRYKAYASAKTAGQPEAMTAYQQATIEGKRADQQLRMLEIEEKRLDRQLKRETDQLKKQELEQKLSDTQKEKSKVAEQDKIKITEGIYQAQQNKQAITDFLNNDDYIDAATGFFNYSKVPESARTTTQNEASAYLDNIKNSMTIENLGVMSGPLTDKDIQIIASASSRLREGMSENALKKELKTIQSAYDRVINNYQKEANKKGYTTEQQSKTVNWSDL